MYSFSGERKKPPKYIVRNVRVKLVFLLVSGFEIALRKHISLFFLKYVKSKEEEIAKLGK